MMPIQRWLCAALAASLVAFGLAAAGCDDSNANPIPDDSPIPRTTARAGRSAGAVAGKGNSAGVGGASNGATAGEAGRAGASVAGGGGMLSGVLMVAGAGAGGASGTGTAGKPAVGGACKPVDIDSDNGSTRGAFDNASLAKWPNGAGNAPTLP
ncbi:MAG: hypothetical protein RL701_2709 [Pseudomonadota bacterium]|jgi:hypothetical protein